MKTWNINEKQNITTPITRTQDISQLIQSLFDSAGDNIEPVIISTDTLAAKELSDLIYNFETSKDWDDQLAVIQHAMSLVKGNACNFPSFVMQLPSFVPSLGCCILNTRSTLVKYSCIFVSQLVKTLKERFENFGEAILPTLFQPTSNGTQIIASSCRYAIFSIVHNCQSPKVLYSILEQVSSESQIQRSVAAEGIKFTVNEWSRNSLFPYFKQLEKAIYNLLSDSNFDARNHARLSSSQMMKLFPDRNSILFPTIKNVSTDNSSINSASDLSSQNIVNNSAEFPSKKSSLYSKDFSNTISFSYQPSQNNDNSKSPKKLESNKSPKSNKIQNIQFISNIPLKKGSNHSFQRDDSDNEFQSDNFSFEPKIPENTNKSQQISIIPTSKPKNEANSISFHYDPNAQTTGPSLIRCSQGKINEGRQNMSVHFIPTTIMNDNNKINDLENNFKNEDDFLKREPRIELSSTNYFTTSMAHLRSYECIKGKEEDFLDSVRTTIATKQTVYIEDNADLIANGFLLCLSSHVESVQISALNLFVDVIKIIPKSFDACLENIVQALLEKADKNKYKSSMNASTALRAISSQFPSEKLLLIGIKCEVSEALLSFAANLVRINESVIYNNEISAALLPICCMIYETTKEQRFSALSVGLLNKINESNPNVFAAFASSVDEQWMRLLKSLYLEPKDKSKYNSDILSINGAKRVLSSMAKFKTESRPENRLDDIMRKLNVEKNKYDILNELINFFKETNSETFDVAIPYLVDLIRSAYYEQVEECIKVIAKTEGGVAISSFLDAVVDHFKMDTSLKSIDFLRHTVQYYKSRDLSPRVHEILEKVKPLLDDPQAEMRKAAVNLIVELRSSIGRQFDGEINKLQCIKRKMVIFYFSKKQNSSVK